MYKCKHCPYKTRVRKNIRSHARLHHRVKCWKQEKKNSGDNRNPYKSRVSEYYEVIEE